MSGAPARSHKLRADCAPLLENSFLSANDPFADVGSDNSANAAPILVLDVLIDLDRARAFGIEAIIAVLSWSRNPEMVPIVFGNVVVFVTSANLLEGAPLVVD